MKLIRNTSLFTVLLLVLYSLSGCERDDICAEGTPTTPFVIIKFLNNETQIVTDIKRPVELQVKAVGVEETFDIGTVRDSILIPLRTNLSSTEFEFTINSDTTNDDIPANTDIVNFVYNPVEEFVSSACGFRVTYDALGATEGEEGMDGDWIKEIRVERSNVVNEESAHIFIFH